jgi:hypothetical protein
MISNFPICVDQWTACDQRLEESSAGRFIVTGFGYNTHGRRCAVSFPHLLPVKIHHKPNNSNESSCLKGISKLIIKIFGNCVAKSSETRHTDDEACLNLVFTNKRSVDQAYFLFKNQEISNEVLVPEWFKKERHAYEFVCFEGDKNLARAATRAFPQKSWLMPVGLPMTKNLISSSAEDLHFYGRPLLRWHDHNFPDYTDFMRNGYYPTTPPSQPPQYKVPSNYRPGSGIRWIDPENIRLWGSEASCAAMELEKLKMGL